MKIPISDIFVVIGIFIWNKLIYMLQERSQNKFFSLKIAKKIILCLIIIFIFDFFFFAMPAFASAEHNDDLQLLNTEKIIINEKIAEIRQNLSSFPQTPDNEFKKIGYYSLTAYNSEVSQCDDSPCITANGFNVCRNNVEDTVAANFLPFGTKVRIPDLYGDRVFIVRDRMNARFQKTIDIWMKDRAKAIEFGVKVARIEIAEP